MTFADDIPGDLSYQNGYYKWRAFMGYKFEKQVTRKEKAEIERKEKERLAEVERQRLERLEIARLAELDRQRLERARLAEIERKEKERLAEVERKRLEIEKIEKEKQEHSVLMKKVKTGQKNVEDLYIVENKFKSGAKNLFNEVVMGDSNSKSVDLKTKKKNLYDAYIKLESSLVKKHNSTEITLEKNEYCKNMITLYDKMIFLIEEKTGDIEKALKKAETIDEIALIFESIKLP
jgi:hypothetical protein